MSDAAALRRMIDAAGRIAIFTGAGISTDSGIPDFRGTNGVWTKMQPIQFQDFVADPAARRETWRRRFDSDDVMRAARPNRGHRAVALLLRQGKAQAVITQNIDGLHQASGIPDDQVIELHGNSTYASCLDCGTRHGIQELRAAFDAQGEVPGCTACGGLVKTATISFGQSMPEEPMRRAQEETLAAELFLVLGSSLVVHPAAGFPEIAKRRGARLVILNRQATPLDDLADLVIRDGIAEALGGATGTN
ncbi:Sir2 family NAD-dependent protein deacetylase [Roseomonas sp. CECT 9278]|uniref:SIR2 family NAD-dependent protein deacylase n=1 Tax=Roseomonas sp. CECT 9278 TaxID=2845823 RepID=UPI001E55C3B7|nr:Sir2 family NAD-dependent protein deacetylase [Roseomonas sp. CECT 9278]CAH0238934.1 NAD-dependent protein deacetylase [Roseomonas sp. CECT 9278]